MARQLYFLDNTVTEYLYLKMADHIEERIRSGDLPGRAALPAERQLAGEYGVSLGTARRATDVLRERGLVLQPDFVILAGGGWVNVGAAAS